MSQSTRWKSVGTIILLAGLLSPIGCGAGSGVSREGPVRSIWVTRWDYRTAEDIRQIVADCDSIGINAILFQVRGNGTVFYPSEIEPWAEEFGHQSPGYDPLATVIDEAHARGIQLHAWVNVMPAWRGEKPPTIKTQLYHTHPQWHLCDQNGNRQPLTDHYVILNPCLPDVRAYLVSVFREICANYAIDGLHMDYIRFVTHGSAEGADYPYDAATLELFRQTGHDRPSDNPEAWDDFRRRAVSQVVEDVHDMMRWVRPSAELSASVFPRRASVYTSHFQDGGRWMEEGWVDLLFPMIYTANMDDFVSWAEDWRAHAHGTPVIPGLGLYKHEDHAETIEQLQQSWEWGDGYCMFAYSSLFTSPGKDEGGREPRLADQRRKERLEALRPVLLSMARKHIAE